MIAATADGSLACAIFSKAPNKVFGWGYDQQYPKINIYFPNLGVITKGQKVRLGGFCGIRHTGPSAGNA
jgi:hypothetical protein